MDKIESHRSRSLRLWGCPVCWRNHAVLCTFHVSLLWKFQADVSPQHRLHKTRISQPHGRDITNCDIAATFAKWCNQIIRMVHLVRSQDRWTREKKTMNNYRMIVWLLCNNIIIIYIPRTRVPQWPLSKTRQTRQGLCFTFAWKILPPSQEKTITWRGAKQIERGTKCTQTASKTISII